jgi:O-antigen/teichoic acid export membrane protein
VPVHRLRKSVPVHRLRKSVPVRSDHTASNRPRSSIRRRMSISVVGNSVGPLCAIGAIPVITHSLGVTGRGITAAGTAPLLLIGVGLTLGIPDAITYKLASSGRPNRGLIRAGMVASILIGLCGMAVVLALRHVLSGRQNVVAEVITLSALAIPLTLALGTIRSVAAGLHQWTRVSLERAIGSIAELVAIIILVELGRLTVVSATLVISFSPLIGGVFYLGMHGNLIKGMPEEIPSTISEVWKSLRGYAARIWLGSVSGIMLSRLDQVLMVPLASTTQLGLYAVAVSVSELPLVINSAVRDVMFSSDAERQDDTQLFRAARISTALVALAGLAIYGLMYIFIVPIFGPGFHGALVPIGLLTLGVIFGNPGSVAAASLSARGHPGVRSIIVMAASLFNILLIVLFVPSLGATGASVATLGANSMAAFVAIVVLSRRYKVSAKEFLGLRRTDVELLRDLAIRVARRLTLEG